MLVQTSTMEVDLEGDYCNDVPGLCVTCRRCGHAVEVFGTTGRSARAAAAMLAQECPSGGKRNYYVVDDHGETQS